MAPPKPDRSDEELLIAALAVGGEARNELISELFGRHYDKVARWCLQFTRNEADALDVAQEVFVKAHRSVEGFRHDSSVGTWLYVIARRTCLDLARSARRKATDSLDEDLERTLVLEEDDALAKFEEKERAGAVRHGMMIALNAKERQALSLRFVDGMTLPEITDYLGLENRSGAKALIVSAFRKLRKHFNSPAAGEGRMERQVEPSS